MCENYSQIFQTPEGKALGLRLQGTHTVQEAPKEAVGLLGIGTVCPWPETAVSSHMPSGREHSF